MKDVLCCIGDSLTAGKHSYNWVKDIQLFLKKK